MSTDNQEPVHHESKRFGSQQDLAGAFFNSFNGQSRAIKTLPEQLAEKLVEFIIGGVFQPGQRLHEVMIAEQFGVSRGPVREALRLLEREGMVTMASRRGATVTKLTAKILRDIFPVRAALMGICAADLARRQSTRVQASLDEGTAKLFKANEACNVREFVVLVYQLSMYIAEAAGNEIARTILFSLGRQTLPLTRRVFEDADHRSTWANNWRDIVAGIRAGDPVAASHAAHNLLDAIESAALTALTALDEAQSERTASTKPAKKLELFQGEDVTVEQGL